MPNQRRPVRVVFLGSRPLGAHAIRTLQAMPDVQMVGAVVRAPPAGAWWKDDPFHLAGVPHVTHEDLATLDFDFGVSVNYWKIIAHELIVKPSLGFINIHHSSMLSLRGRDMTTHAILNARKSGRWYHGTTLHYTDDGLDTGPIIATDSCPITEQDTAWSLMNKVEVLARSMLDLWLPRLLTTRAPTAKPEEGHPLHYRSSLPSKEIQLHPDTLRAYDVVRAFDFANHFEPAYTMLDGKKTYLTICRELAAADVANPEVADAGAGRIIYRSSYVPPHRGADAAQRTGHGHP